MKLSRFFAVASVVLLVSAFSAADSFDIPAYGSGWCNDGGYSAGYGNGYCNSDGSFNDNIFSGSADVPGNFNNFFYFDVSGVSGTVVSASLNVYNDPNNYSNGTYNLFGPTSLDYFGLQGGLPYGSLVITPADQGVVVTINLNSDGVAAINSGSPFWIGGSFAGDQFTGYTGGETARFLHVETRGQSEVPEPASLALLGTGMVGLAGRLRRRFAR